MFHITLKISSSNLFSIRYLDQKSYWWGSSSLGSLWHWRSITQYCWRCHNSVSLIISNDFHFPVLEGTYATEGCAAIEAVLLDMVACMLALLCWRQKKDSTEWLLHSMRPKSVNYLLRSLYWTIFWNRDIYKNTYIRTLVLHTASLCLIPRISWFPALAMSVPCIENLEECSEHCWVWCKKKRMKFSLIAVEFHAYITGIVYSKGSRGILCRTL